MNEIIRKITAQNFLNLKSAFENSKDIFWDEEKKALIHPGEYGTYRENLIKTWLRMYLPKNFDICSGFIINSENEISTQCDIIIYNKEITPHIENSDKQNFFPIESVVAVGEVKSTINSVSELNKYLIKLSEIKKMRNYLKGGVIYRNIFEDEFNINKNPFHNVFTFLICYKLNFNYNLKSINYSSINYHYHHNIILSLNDGTFNYINKGGNIAHPYVGNKIYKQTFFKATESELPGCIIFFLSSISMAARFTLLMEVDMATYLSNESDLIK